MNFLFSTTSRTLELFDAEYTRYFAIGLLFLALGPIAGGKVSRDLLLSELETRKKKNPKYSLRAFARDLGISAGHLSQLLRGRKTITIRQATAIASKLRLSRASRERLLRALVPALESGGPPAEELRLLREDEFALISDWYHLAILNLVLVPQLATQPRQIARRLGISETESSAAIDRLIRLGLLARRNGLLVRTSRALRTSTDVPSQAIRFYHKQNLDLAKSKIDKVPLRQREFSSITMPINTKSLPEAKKLIEEFRNRMNSELETREPQEVYTLSIQLFPLTKEEGEP